MPGNIDYLRGHRYHAPAGLVTDVEIFTQAIHHPTYLSAGQMRILFQYLRGDGLGKGVALDQASAFIFQAGSIGRVQHGGDNETEYQ